MKNRNSYRKFQPHIKKIEALEKTNSRFKRIYDEYEHISDELWELESNDSPPLPDDFITAIQLQANYLEDEIDEWLDRDEAQAE